MNLTDPQRVTQTIRSFRALQMRKGVDATRLLLKEPTLMENPNIENSDFVKNSVLYKEFLAEREEILKHKWIESEKLGHDIGFEKALLDWIVKYRSSWRERRQKAASAARN